MRIISCEILQNKYTELLIHASNISEYFQCWEFFAWIKLTTLSKFQLNTEHTYILLIIINLSE